VVTYRCPKCKALLESADDLAGGTDRCPLCGSTCQVPVPKPSDPRILLFGIVGAILAVVAIGGALFGWVAYKNQWDNAHRSEILAIKSRAENFGAHGQIKEAHAAYAKLLSIVGDHQATTSELSSAIQNARDAATQAQTAYDELVRQEEQQRIARAERERIEEDRVRQLEEARQEKAREAAQRLAEIQTQISTFLGNSQLAQIPPLLREAMALDPTASILRPSASDLRTALYRSSAFTARATLKGHTDWVEKIAITPDSTKIISGSSDGTLRIWDASTGSALNTIKSGGWASAFGLASDGRTIVVQVQTQQFQVWDLQTFQLDRQFSRESAPGESRVGGLWTQLSPSGKFAVTGGIGQYQKGYPVYVWDVETGRLAAAMLGHSAGVLCAAISPDGRILATGTFDCGASNPEIGIWDVATSRPLKIFEVNHNQKEEIYTTNINGLAFTPDGKRLVSSSGKTIRVWSIPDGTPVSEIFLDRAEAKSLDVSPDGRTVASVVMTHPDDKDVYNVALFDLESGKVLQVLDAGGTCRCLAYSNDGMTIVTGGTDKMLRIWRRDLDEPWKRDALALCDQIDRQETIAPTVVDATAEQRWSAQARAGTAALEDKQRELQYQANVKAQLERSRAEEKARREAFQNQPDQPRGIANRICQNLKERGMIDSATFINYFEVGGVHQWDDVPQNVDRLCVRYQFVFTTRAGLSRTYDGYVALYKRDGDWNPDVVNVDGVNNVPASQFLTK